jgi:hypothetical protein
MQSMARLARTGALAATLLAGAAPAGASGGGGIRLGDVPNTHGTWQEGSAVIAAPLPEVRRWLTDFDTWPGRFPDVQSASTLRRDGDVTTGRFRSRIIGRDMTIHLRQGSGGMTYTGEGKNVTTQGKVFLRALDPGHTQVIMQSTAQVHGLAGAFASPGTKRKRALRKIDSDLTALQSLASRTSAR